MLDFEASGTAPKRQALVVMTYPPASNPIEMEVDLDAGAVLSHELVSLGKEALYISNQKMQMGRPCLNICLM
jgi:hypothetical protein